MLLMILVMTLTSTKMVKAVTWEHVLDLYEKSAEKHANNEHIREVWCSSRPIDTPGSLDDVDNYNNPFLGVKWHIILRGCAPPAPPDKPSLKWPLMTRGYMPGEIKRIELIDIPHGTRFNESHFEGLEFVEYLKVHTASHSRSQQLKSDFIKPLTNVTWLTIENEALPSLPEKNRIGIALLVGGRSLGVWGGCRNLRALHLNDWCMPLDAKLARDWVKNCKRLEYLKAEHMDHDSLQAVLVSARNLLELQLPRNNLTAPKLANILQNGAKVIWLDVSFNNLTHINGLDKQLNLRMLNMSYNMVSDFGYLLRCLQASSVTKLWLDHNPLHNYCDWYNPAIVTDDINLPSLKELSLIGVGASQLCFAKWNSLHVLNLTGNNVEELQFEQLPTVSKKDSLTVDLRRNPLHRVHFTEKDYYALKSNRNATNMENNQVEKALLTVQTDLLPPFDCNCQNGWLARALRENLVALSAGALCQRGGQISTVPSASLECDLLPCAPCRCQRQWPGPGVAMHCEEFGFRDILQLPKQSNIDELHLRGNNIVNIRFKDLPDTLTLLDLRNNNLTRVDATHVADLLQVSNRRLLLAGNPITCDCNNWPLLATLRIHRVQVDYENITCGSGGPLLYDVSEQQLCGVGVWQGLSAGIGALVGIIALSGALYARYERQLKVWLYARGWCLCCVCEEMLDADREYDVFLSFAHGDQKFVATQLLPGLEGGTNSYKVCVHYRDWTPGELIPTQITRSVASSRRTVIVLSAHFLQSMWGLMEFRAAHVSALAERRVRVLVVALDDAPSIEELPFELRLYLHTTTYLCWNDTRFWDRFRYALPHRVNQEIKHKQTVRTV